MAGAAIASLLGGVASSAASSLVGAGANAINQSVEFGYNQQLQQNSFQHDINMLGNQVKATGHLQAQLYKIRELQALQGGYTPTDAARLSLGAPTSKVLDWAGTRYYAPGAMRTSSYSGAMMPNPVTFGQRVQVPQQTKLNRAQSLYSDSWGQPQASRSTESTTLSRTESWVSNQAGLRDYYRTAFVSPPGSASSGSVRSTGSSIRIGSSSVFVPHRGSSHA
uniref:VP2 minor structural protein n=1 Tax=California sea lion norovirus TaxID=2070151 RepID=A0A2R2ZGC9_9CALI|nr:VP2 minor structural protein [California sea lion norovirus]